MMRDSSLRKSFLKGIIAGSILLAGCAWAYWQFVYLDWEISLEAYDKDAFGAAAVRQQFSHLYPEASLTILPQKPVTALAFHPRKASCYVIIGTNLPMPDYEVEELLAYAAAGNTLIVAATEALPLWRQLRLAARDLGPRDSLNLLVGDTGKRLNWRFDHAGPALAPRADQGWKPLIQTPEKAALALKRRWGEGEIIISTLPLAFSNYYLVREAGPILLSCLMPNGSFKEILWDEWYKPKRLYSGRGDDGNTADYALLRFLFQQKAFRWGLSLLMLTGGLFLLFGSRRQQRAVPEDDDEPQWIAPYLGVIARMQARSSDGEWVADWVDQTWLDWQQRYHIRTSPSSPDFVRELAAHWGQPLEGVRPLFLEMKAWKEIGGASDQAVLQLYRRLRELESPSATP